jgi:hypothetical protein
LLKVEARRENNKVKKMQYRVMRIKSFASYALLLKLNIKCSFFSPRFARLYPADPYTHIDLQIFKVWQTTQSAQKYLLGFLFAAHGF